MRNLALLVVAASIATGPRPLAPPREQQAEGVQRDVVVGIAKWYDQYPMEDVLKNRGMDRPPGYVGLASTPYCHLLRSTVWASLNGGSWKRYFVCDCSDPTRKKQDWKDPRTGKWTRIYVSDQDRHLCSAHYLKQTNNAPCTPIVIEVDRGTAVREGFSNGGSTTAKVRYGDGHYIPGD